MNEDTGTIFEIRLDETGVVYIRKLSKIAVSIFILSLILSIISIFFELYHYFNPVNLPTKDKWLFLWTRISSWVIILTIFLNLVASIYYFKFMTSFNRSIVEHNSALFNTSFKYIFRNSVLFLCVLIINLVIYGRLFIILFL
jgi:hypothetical protein